MRTGVVRAGQGASTGADPRPAAIEAALSAAGAGGAQAGGAHPPSLAVVVASPEHGEAAEAVLAGVHEAVGPAHVIGCVAESVVSGGREFERGPVVSVWLAHLPAEVDAFHMQFARTETGGAFTGWRFGADRPGSYLLIADPYTFPADVLLQHLNENVPGTVVVGGMASGGRAPGATRLLFDDQVVDHGAVGVRMNGITLRTLVSQGCRPIGRPLTVTRSEGNLVAELAGRPPLEVIRDLFASLPPADRALVQMGLHVGRVIDEYKEVPARGDFLIRGVLGGDQESGALAIGDHVEVGETIQFHVRDAVSADEDLRLLLEQTRSEIGDQAAAGLLFTCNGRGTNLFPGPDHDAAMIQSMMGELPLTGFFAAGELGPIGGKNFLHGFTASLALLVEDPPPA